MRTLLLLLPLAALAGCEVEDPAAAELDPELARVDDRIDVRGSDVDREIRCTRDVTRRDELACYDLADQCEELGVSSETTRQVLSECLRAADAGDCEPTEERDRE